MSQYYIFSFQDWLGEFMRLGFDPKVSDIHLALPKQLRALGIKSVIVEDQYVDADYSSAFTHFYSHAFNPPKRWCTRHLFFAENIKTAAGLYRTRAVKSYKGCVTIWPTDPPVIGRTVLPFPEIDGAIKVLAPYEAHVNGVTLHIESALIASKDFGVSTCATVVTWLATDILQRKFGLKSCSSTEITLLAAGEEPKWGRPLPQIEGLSSDQIVRALCALGYNPYRTEIDSDKWRGQLYGYISSGIPVILQCELIETKAKTKEVTRSGRHAVLVIGLATEGRPPEVKNDNSGFTTKRFSRTVTKLILHDDRYGPFGILELDQGSGFPVNVKYDVDEKNIQVTMTDMIIPVPGQVNMLSWDAHTMGSKFLIRAARSSKYLKQPSYIGPCRTFLTPSALLKKQSKLWKGKLSKVYAEIRDTAMPKWIWVTEAYPSDAVSPSDSEPIARAILDATQLGQASETAFLVGHVERVIIEGPIDIDARGLS